MKKFILTILLLALIALIFVFIFARVGALGSDDNYFNSNWRGQLAKSPAMRSILGLHNSGDAKSDFLLDTQTEIFIEVDSMAGLPQDLELLEQFADKVEAITGKTAKIILSNNTVPYSRSVSAQQVNDIYDGFKDYSIGSTRAVVYLLIASKDSETPTLVGSTLNESGLVLFVDSLEEFAATRTLELYNAYFVSTLLHEFGHQLGLDHNTEPGCLMNEQVELSTSLRQSAIDVVKDFCPYELDQLEEIKMKL